MSANSNNEGEDILAEGYEAKREAFATQLGFEAKAQPTKTLRDEFAMAALTGLLASDTQDTSTVFAKLSFAMADAMMKAREVKS